MHDAPNLKDYAGSLCECKQGRKEGPEGHPQNYHASAFLLEFNVSKIGKILRACLCKLLVRFCSSQKRSQFKCFRGQILLWFT